MRHVVVLRGAPACGKSTWVRERGLRAHAIGLGDFRVEAPKGGVIAIPSLVEALGF
ncbi:hypothetical protein [Actinomyces culturomici]|uniref:hypothetical protein n=1 Tax=Actinomyces culturomici TaxID=1926276 RepID=UPI00135ADB56|nr:hypothetical protein [Actinomyces culturomici]